MSKVSSGRRQSSCVLENKVTFSGKEEEEKLQIKEREKEAISS